jgi:hypothetical protein
MVRNLLVWWVRKEHKVQIGLYTWIGSGGLHRLSPQLICDLRDRGLYTLRRIASQDRTTIW